MRPEAIHRLIEREMPVRPNGKKQEMSLGQVRGIDRETKIILRGFQAGGKTIVRFSLLREPGFLPAGLPDYASALSLRQVFPTGHAAAPPSSDMKSRRLRAGMVSPHPVQPVSRTLSLARRDWLVLGPTLNRSESRRP
jgi:hypothetical protein